MFQIPGIKEGFEEISSLLREILKELQQIRALLEEIKNKS